MGQFWNRLDLEVIAENRSMLKTVKGWVIPAEEASKYKSKR